MNAALARVALDALAGILPVDARSWAQGFALARIPARFEVVRAGGKSAILDGAHNPEAMRSLARTWEASPWAGKPSRWIVGVMKDKDSAGMLRAVSRHLREVVTVRPPSPRAMDAVSLARAVRLAAPSARVSVERDPETALRSWLSRGPRTAVVCGSFYLAGRAAEVLGRMRG